MEIQLQIRDLHVFTQNLFFYEKSFINTIQSE